MTDPGGDAELVDRLRRGDAGALDAVYRAWSGRLWAFLARLCGNADDAADVFQETWVAVARGGRRIRADTRLGPWLYTVARNQHVSMKRRSWTELRRRMGLALEPAKAMVGPDATQVLRLENTEVAAAFGQLGASAREVLLLCVVDELSHAEVAVVLGLREDAVRKRLSRARSELQAVLAAGSRS